MKVFKNHFYARSGWIQKPIAAHGLQQWLLQPASLTQQLIALGQGFHVETIAQGKRKANFDESLLLGIGLRDEVFLREVLLYCGNQPVVFAHSITTMGALQQCWRSLQGLGNQSLGTMLFSNPQVSRTAFQFKKLNHHHPLMRRIRQNSQIKDTHILTDQALWARRSQFFLRQKTNAIVVTEVFLPALLKMTRVKP